MLPARERYIAGFVERLPEGAAMSVKCLAKLIPLYGQQAVASALTALSVAGHPRRVRCAVGEGGQVRWVFRAYWSRTARDNEWRADDLARLAPEPEGAASSPAYGRWPGWGAGMPGWRCPETAAGSWSPRPPTGSHGVWTPTASSAPGPQVFPRRSVRRSASYAVA